MTLHAEEVPVKRILIKLAETGLRVKADPGLELRVTADFADREIGSALAAILKSADHVLVWETVDGPVGPITRLAEVQLFRAGQKDRIRRLPAARRIVVDSETGSAYVAGELLIRLKPGVSRETFEQVLDEIRGWIVDSHPVLGVYRVRVSDDADLAALAKRLAEQRAAEAVEPNYAYPLIVSRSAGAVFSTFSAAPDAAAHSGDFPIAVLDTGISSAQLQTAQVLSAYNAIEPDLPASDELGHGTRMALLASGAVLPIGISVEPRSLHPVVAVKAFDENGYVSAFDFARSIDFAASQKARVMSLSWGSGTDSRFLKDALEYADKLGMVVVAAAGNDPTGEAMYPAAYGTVIGVGALAPSGKRWDSSNFGDHVAIYAPGFAGFDTDGDRTADEAYAGTSVSTAFVAHLVAGLLSRQPELARDQVMEVLRRMLVHGE